MSVMLNVNPTVWSVPREPSLLSTDAEAAPALASADANPWPALRRYLLLGGVAVVPSRSVPVTPSGADPVRAALAVDSLRVVAEILAATAAAPVRPEPMLLALALASASDDDLTRRAALTALPRVARTSRDLFLFAGFVQGLRGWGRGLRRAVGSWYNDRPVAELVEDVLTTPAHAGWRHADLLRLGHPRAPTATHDAVYRWLVTGTVPAAGPPDPSEPNAGDLLARLAAASRLAEATEPEAAAATIAAHRLPLACVPEPLRRSAAVWTALLPHLTVPELLDNLPALAASGGLEPGSDSLAMAQCRLTDGTAIVKERIPPLTFVAARRAYETDHLGARRWTVDPDLLRALDQAFDLACRRLAPLTGTVEFCLPDGLAHGPSGAAPLAAIDVVATAALALIRSGADVAVTVAGNSGWPLRLDPAGGLDEAVALLLRALPAGDASPTGSGPISVRSIRPDGPERTIDLWLTLPDDATPPVPADGRDRVAVHGVDQHLVGTIIALLGDAI